MEISKGAIDNPWFIRHLAIVNVNARSRVHHTFANLKECIKQARELKDGTADYFVCALMDHFQGHVLHG